jgi:hypothetical protein
MAIRNNRVSIDFITSPRFQSLQGTGKVQKENRWHDSPSAPFRFASKVSLIPHDVETLIVWTEPHGTDMALSFQEPEGCAAIW